MTSTKTVLYRLARRGRSRIGHEHQPELAPERVVNISTLVSKGGRRPRRPHAGVSALRCPVLVVAAVDMYGDLVSRASGHLATPIQRGLPLAAADLVRGSLLAQSWIHTVAIGHRESQAASSSRGSLMQGTQARICARVVLFKNVVQSPLGAFRPAMNRSLEPGSCGKRWALTRLLSGTS